MGIYVTDLWCFDHRSKPIIMYHMMFIDVFSPHWLRLNHNEKSICDVGTHIGRHDMANKQRVLMHGHQGWNVRHGLWHIYMRYLYIYMSFL